MPLINPSSSSEHACSWPPTPKSSIAGPIRVSLEDKISLHENCITLIQDEFDGELKSPIYVLSIVHLAWMVTVQTYARDITFCVSGDYASGLCGVYDSDIPGLKVVELTPDDSVEKVLRQLMITMTSNKPCEGSNVSSLGRGKYNAIISYASSLKKETAGNMPLVRITCISPFKLLYSNLHRGIFT
jgi:hypothetical protein